MHTISPVNHRRYHFIVPRKGPYFIQSLKVTYRGQDGVARTLVEGKDWLGSYWFLGATRGLELPVYGGVSFLNSQLTGTIEIEYQSIGGEWTLDDRAIEEILGDRIHNPLTTTWEVIAKVPKLFNPEPHAWEIENMVKMDSVYKALDSIAVAIRLKNDPTGLGGNAHIADKNNPHNVTKAQVQLEKVRNLATLPLTGHNSSNSNDYYLTPQSARLIIANAVGDAFNAFRNNKNNPTDVTAAQVNAYDKEEMNVLLANKLSVTDVAFDTQRFNGLTYEEAKADILTGTALNATQLDGRDLPTLVTEIARSIANSDTFGGRDSEAYRDYVLEGTAANATRFNGRDDTELLAWLTTQGIGGATSLGNRTAAEWEQYIADATVANASKFGGMDFQAFLQALHQADVDADTLNGYTYSDIVNAANNNILSVFGKDEATLKADILSGTADNATKFAGKTETQWDTRIKNTLVLNAERVNGKSFPELVQAVAGEVNLVVGNAGQFAGRTWDVAVQEIQSGTVANAQKLNGETKDDIKNEIFGDIRPLTQQKRIVPAPVGTTPANFRYYELLVVDYSTLTADNKATSAIVNIENLLRVSPTTLPGGVSNVTARINVGLDTLSDNHLTNVAVEFVPTTGTVLTAEQQNALRTAIGLYAEKDSLERKVTYFLQVNKAHRGYSVAEVSVNPVFVTLPFAPQEVDETRMSSEKKVNFTTHFTSGVSSGGGVTKGEVDSAVEALKISSVDPLGVSVNSMLADVQQLQTSYLNLANSLSTDYMTKNDAATLAQTDQNHAREISRLKAGDVLRTLTAVGNTFTVDFENGEGFYCTATGGNLTVNFKPRTYVGTHELTQANGVVQEGYLVLDYSASSVITWTNAVFKGGSAPTLVAGRRYVLRVTGFSFLSNSDVFGTVVLELVSEL